MSTLLIWKLHNCDIIYEANNTNTNCTISDTFVAQYRTDVLFQMFIMLLSVKQKWYLGIRWMAKNMCVCVYIYKYMLKVWNGFNVFLMQMNVQHLDVLFFLFACNILNCKVIAFYSSFGAFWFPSGTKSPYLIPLYPSHMVPFRYSMPTLPSQSVLTVYYTKRQMPFSLFTHLFFSYV